MTKCRVKPQQPAFFECGLRPMTKPVWLFDLDNTCTMPRHIFPHQSGDGNTSSATSASTSRRPTACGNYWQRYGATLLGLMRHHNTDPRHFPGNHQFLTSSR